ncbi:MAG: PTS sugar transporter subunit IIC [Erysipelotrichaceae bacterium]
MMDKFVDIMDRRVMPIANKVGGQIHIRSIGNGMTSLIGIIILASMATLVQNLQIDAYQTFLTTTQFGQVIWNVCQNIWWGTMAMWGLLICASVGQSLWKNYGHSGLEGLGVALASYLVTTPWLTQVPAGEASIPAFGFLNYTHLSADSLFTCMIVALLSVTILHHLSNLKALQVKMPDVVPPAVSESFSKLFPAMISVTLFAILAYTISTVADGMVLSQLITKFISAPISGLTGNIWSAMFIPFLVSFLWFFGIHGSNILGPLVGVALSPAGMQNLELFQKGVSDWSQYNVFTNQFLFSFVYMGGAACTIGLIVAMFISNRRRHKMLLTLAGPTAIFNINEPVIFGFPVVLNPMLFIPFVIGPSIISAFSYIMIEMGLVHPVVATVPWTTPPILNGFLATGMHWTGAALSIVNIIIVVIIYLPFLKLIERQENEKIAATLAKEGEK